MTVDNKAATQPDYGLLRMLDRVIVVMMVTILLVLTLPVMQATHAPKSAQATQQKQTLSPKQHAAPAYLVFS